MHTVEALAAVLRDQPSARSEIEAYDAEARALGASEAAAKDIVTGMLADDDTALLVGEAFAMLDDLVDAERQLLGGDDVDAQAVPAQGQPDQERHARAVLSLFERGLLDPHSLRAPELLALARFIVEEPVA